MAITPSVLGQFVMREGFSWPTSESAPSVDYSVSDDTLVRRLREMGLVRADVTDAEIVETFHAARREHADYGYSLYNSPEERVRVFLHPHLTEKGLQWAEPRDVRMLLAEHEKETRSIGRPWWRFWTP